MYLQWQMGDGGLGSPFGGRIGTHVADPNGTTFEVVHVGSVVTNGSGSIIGSGGPLLFIGQ